MSQCTPWLFFLSCNACWHMSPGWYLYKTWWASAEDISYIASQKAERHAYATRHAAAISQQLLYTKQPTNNVCSVSSCCLHLSCCYTAAPLRGCGEMSNLVIAHFCSVLQPLGFYFAVVLFIHSFISSADPPTQYKWCRVSPLTPDVPNNSKQLGTGGLMQYSLLWCLL